MRDHLRPEEFVDALDDALHVSRRAHLADCEACRAELAGLRSAVTEAGGVEPAAPSPLFWDHFSNRVRLATAIEPLPSAATWSAWWRPAGALVGAIGAVALVVLLRPVPPAPSGDSDTVNDPVAYLMADPDDGSWGLVVDLASQLEWADVNEVATPAAGTADALIDELSSAQREALARLLQKEMGDL